jgi:hypothetical protein
MFQNALQNRTCKWSLNQLLILFPEPGGEVGRGGDRVSGGNLAKLFLHHWRSGRISWSL